MQIRDDGFIGISKDDVKWKSLGYSLQDRINRNILMFFCGVKGKQFGLEFFLCFVFKDWIDGGFIYRDEE